MLNTGFYSVVTAKEGERYIDRQSDRETQLQLREEALRHLKEQRGIDVAAIISDYREQEQKKSH